MKDREFLKGYGCAVGTVLLLIFGLMLLYSPTEVAHWLPRGP